MIACGSLSQKDLSKAKNITQAYPASTKQGKEQNRPLLDTKRGKKESFTTVTTNICACSPITPGYSQKKLSLVLLASFLLG